MTKIEIVTHKLEDIKRLKDSNIERIIYLDHLDKGGLSPRLESVEEAFDAASVPMRVMVRMKSENYVYSDDEFNQLLEYVEGLKIIGVEGIVFGSLTKDNKIDFNQLERIIEIKGNLKLTFNKAFDELEENVAVEQFDILSKYDVDCLMTVGTKTNVFEGQEVIKEITNRSTIEIMPAAGINLSNAKEVVNLLGASILHIGSAVRTDGEISIEKLNELISVLK